MSEMKNVVIEGAHIIFRNFAGNADKFNPKGNRNFSVILDPEQAEAMKRDGWTVKYLKARDEEDEPTPFVPVSLNYNYMAPRVYLIDGNQKTELDEDTIEFLDDAELENVDLILRPYQWEYLGRTGVKAQLKTMYCTLAKDELSSKYARPVDDEPLPFT